MRASRSTVVTPTARNTLRRVAPMLILIAITLVTLYLTVLLPSLDEDPRPLSSTNTTPNGARALVEVLREHGVEVDAAGKVTEALGAAQDGATLVVVFPARMDPEVADAVEELPSVVYVGTETVYGELIPGVSADAFLADDSTRLHSPSCSAPAAVKAGSVTNRGYGVLLDSKADGWTGCFPTADGSYGYAEGTTAAGWRAVMPDHRVLRNDSITEAGNAALAINAIARTGSVVWYLADPNDQLTDPPAVEAPFLIPLVIIICGAGLLAGFAHGRRLGRLVPEVLPSYVPAAETLIGRGRLLRRSRDHAHSALALRTETATRLASRMGIPTNADAEELLAALVARGADRHVTHDLLWGPAPTTGEGLVALADALAQLEESIRND